MEKSDFLTTGLPGCPVLASQWHTIIDKKRAKRMMMKVELTFGIFEELWEEAFPGWPFLSLGKVLGLLLLFRLLPASPGPLDEHIVAAVREAPDVREAWRGGEVWWVRPFGWTGEVQGLHLDIHHFVSFCHSMLPHHFPFLTLDLLASLRQMLLNHSHWLVTEHKLRHCALLQGYYTPALELSWCRKCGPF